MTYRGQQQQQQHQQPAAGNRNGGRSDLPAITDDENEEDEDHVGDGWEMDWVSIKEEERRKLENNKRTVW